jgi:16S rRNA (guanine527-N7)-methyltransferase
MVIQHFTYDDFLRYRNVSRETFTRLEQFVGLLEKWQNNINLISASTLPTVWMRHVIDSAQLYDYVTEGDVLLDIGAGGGFPGLVLGILGMKQVTLVESDRRKAAFLQEANRICAAGATVHNMRIEGVDIASFTVLTARAFASVSSLLDAVAAGLTIQHKLLLLKGKSWKQEVDEALRDWSFDYVTTPSITDTQGVILSLRNPQKRGASV